MRKCLIFLFAMLFTINFAVAYTFYDNFDRVETELGGSNYTNGWAIRHISPYPAVGVMNGSMWGAYYSAIGNPTYNGEMLEQNFTDTQAIDLSNDFYIHATLNINDVASNLNNFGDFYYHCIFFFPDKNSLTNYVAVCPDVPRVPLHNKEMVISCGGSCYCPYLESNAGLLSNFTDFYISYDASISKITISREDNTTLNTQITCSLQNNMIALFARTSGIFFDDFTLTNIPFNVTNITQPTITECNDGIDNDGDGFIDFPQDPSCLFDTGSTESPAQGSAQSDDVCSIEQNCLFKETIPYTDSIYMHGWGDLTLNFAPNGYLIQGGNSLLLNSIQNTFLVNFDIYKSFQNPVTTQTALTMKLQMTFQDQQCMMCNGNQSFYYLLPSANNTAVALLFNVDPRAQKVYIANINPDGSNTTIATLSPNFNPTFLPDSLIDITFGLKLSTHQIEYNGVLYPFYRNVTPTLVRIASIDYDSTDIKTWFHTIQIDAVTANSVCTSFSPPIYLKENFITGKLSDCGWSQAPSNFVVQGQLKLTNSQPYFQAYKGFYDSSSQHYIRLDNQYTTTTFDFQPNSISTQTNVLSFSIWDKDSSFLTFLFKKDGTMVSAVKTGTLATLNVNQINSIKIVTNLFTDTYDLYVNGVLQQTGITFDNQPDDVTELGLVYLQSSNSDYTLDNLQVYTSDASGNPQIVFTNPIITGDNTTYGNGLFAKNAKPCVTDADCPTGKCMPYKTCSTFDWTKCDQAGKARDSWCVFTESTYSMFGYLGQVILDNFLLFIVFLILLMIAVYLSIMMRR